MRDNHQDLLWQTLAFAFVVFAFLYATSQLGTPYISHDDLDFLMPTGWTGGYTTPWEKTLTEGRWISFLWYQFSQHLTPKSSYLLYITAYFVLSCILTRHISNPRTSLLCNLAVFFSPMFGDLSLWPTGMFISVAIGSLSMLAILSVKKEYTLPVTSISTFLLILTYPPIAALVLVVAAIKIAACPIRTKIALAIAYVFSFAAGSLAIYCLNYFEHGYFGVKIDAWRNPRPLHSIADAAANLALYYHSWLELLNTYALPIACGVIAAIPAIRNTKTRRAALTMLLAALLICGIELGIVLLTGTPIPARSYVWLWLVICILCVQAAISSRISFKVAGLVLLTLLTIYGMHSWWSLYSHKQPVAAYQSTLATEIRQYETITGAKFVEVVGDPRRNPTFHEMDNTNVLPALSMYMLKQYGIRLEDCTARYCDNIRQYLTAHETQISPLIVLDGKLALVFDINTKPAAQLNSIQRNYPGAFEESELKLGYPTFQRYSPDSVRVTPFFPGSNGKPVSIMLEPDLKGYSFKREGNSCRYPIAYSLKSNTGSQLASGAYDGGTPVTLASWGEKTGSAELTLSMADGAKNNYGCNIVITKIE